MKRFTMVKATAAAALSVAALAASAEPDKPARFAPLNPDQLTSQQQVPAARILAVPSAGLGGPFNVLLRSPELTTRVLGLLDYHNQTTSLPKQLAELAILIEARIATAHYEWWSHHRIAMRVGMRPELAEAIRQGRRPVNMSEAEAAVYDVTTELAFTQRLQDQTFATAKLLLGEQELVDLVVLVGSYRMVSLVLNAGEVGIPKDAVPTMASISEADLRAGLLSRQ